MPIRMLVVGAQGELLHFVAALAAALRPLEVTGLPNQFTTASELANYDNDHQHDMFVIDIRGLAADAVHWTSIRSQIGTELAEFACEKSFVCIVCERGQYDNLGYPDNVEVVEYVSAPNYRLSAWIADIANAIGVADDEARTASYTFTFPVEVSSACQQYLVCFASFLRDIGMSATTDIRHTKSGQVLFSVTPTAPEEALDNIREALEVYLRLPAITPVNDFNPGHEVAILQMQANIDHLRSQLRLAAATIQQQQISIALLTGQEGPTEIFLSASVPQHKPASDKVELLQGAIKLGDMDIAKGGIQIGLGRIYEMLREKFRKM